MVRPVTVTLGGAITAHNLTFNTSGYTLTNNTLTLAGAAPTITVAGGTATINSVVAGSAGVNTTGAGTVVLTGANTYSGGTTITSGALQVGNGGATGHAGHGRGDNNSALIFNRNNAVTVLSAISGTGTLTQAGTNDHPSPARTVTAATTTISAGTLRSARAAARGRWARAAGDQQRDAAAQSDRRR